MQNGLQRKSGGQEHDATYSTLVEGWAEPGTNAVRATAP